MPAPNTPSKIEWDEKRLRKFRFIREAGFNLRKIQIVEESVKDVIFRGEVPLGSSLFGNG
jgi:hypothetical protein